ncbi:DUF962 domain-containing protein [Microbulbifer bruguierae]|uniref:DUF962 domain-containing protein n=1 Tax=Microbulbifer bruguierae TaxID=3029061 RepID=A0ABY8NGT8_9GAMM|nr:DUF962 domain-containing protein [Microbulbifer bruguierae]WGL16937.1 DUF962 domain-containing protein [Microbulbifer bruguierae]
MADTTMGNQQNEPQPATKETPRFTSFKEFYPFYLGEHSNLTCRRLHFVGTALVIGLLITAVTTQKWLLLAALPVAGYGFAWVGHFFFEHNRPATFKNPLYSLWGDFVMFKDILLGKIPR